MSGKTIYLFVSLQNCVVFLHLTSISIAFEKSGIFSQKLFIQIERRRVVESFSGETARPIKKIVAFKIIKFSIFGYFKTFLTFLKN